MPVELNHTIVAATDRDRTADFLVDVLGLGPAPTYGPFRVVALANGVSLDVVGSGGPVHPQHYAFLVSEEEFGLIWARIRERDLGRSIPPSAGRDQHQRRRTRPLLARPGRAQPRDHHPSVRRLSPTDLALAQWP